MSGELLGERIGERFVLVREVGSGDTATIFLGRDEILDRPVAVKVLKSGLEGSGVGARFRREGLSAARLSHPNIAQVFDAGADVLDGREVSYVVTEYLSGGDLRSLVQVRGRLTEVMVSRIGTEISAGLAYAHGRGVMHRAVTPRNVLFDAHGTPKLVDFGLAPDLMQAYSSPQRLRGAKATPADDVYSLGATLYEAATGEPPNGAPPRERGAAIGEFHEAVILSCLAEDPDERPDAAGLRAALLGSDAEEYGPSWSDRVGGTLKTFSTAGASRAARALGKAGAAGAGRLGGSVQAATARRRERQEADEPGRIETVFVGRRTFAGGLDLRAILLAAAVLVLLLILAWSALSALNSGDSADTNTGREAASEQSGDGNAGGSGAAAPGGGETTAAAPEETVPAPPVDTADDVVFNMYVMATENDFEGSWELLSTRYQEEEVGSLEEWEARQVSLTGLAVTREFVAEPDGENQARVSFETQETRDGVVETVSGVWICINEDGEWKLDRFIEQ